MTAHTPLTGFTLAADNGKPLPGALYYPTAVEALNAASFRSDVGIDRRPRKVIRVGWFVFQAARDGVAA